VVVEDNNNNGGFGARLRGESRAMAKQGGRTSMYVYWLDALMIALIAKLES
jgi:hypothetical protein